jgi:hypothetical protein
MRHRLILFPAFIVLLGFSAQANAAGAVSFGSKDTVRFVANTGIKLENGNSMYLGRRITVSSFVLPYNIQDNGYVLAVTGEPGNYSPLPTGPKLQTLQANGFLPQPLPSFHLRIGDYLVGYALWWVLLAIALLVSFIRKALERREYGEDEEP